MCTTLWWTFGMKLSLFCHQFHQMDLCFPFTLPKMNSRGLNTFMKNGTYSPAGLRLGSTEERRRNKHSTGDRSTHPWLCQLCRCLPSLIPASVQLNPQRSLLAFLPSHLGQVEFAWSEAGGQALGQGSSGIEKQARHGHRWVHEVPTHLGRVAVLFWDSQTALNCVCNA